MPGGIWTSQNKVRPGAYINFEGEPVTTIGIGERGVATLTMPLSWGGEGKLITLTSSELVTGDSLAKVGLIYNDADALLLRLALANAGTVKVYNSNVGGDAATKTIAVAEDSGTGLVVTAKHPGTFGNKIALTIKVNEAGVATVETYANGYFVDRQNVTSIDKLVDNDYVTFSGTGTLIDTTSTLLTGGANGAAIANLYTDYFAKLKDEYWNTVAITSTEAADISLAVQFIREMRESEGKYVQAVVANATTSVADYEGIINVVNGITLEDGTQVPANLFTAWVTGATAGAYITDSLTGTVVVGASTILNNLSNNEIIEALQEGKFVLGLNQNGTIRVEKDINSLHSFTATKGYAFSKNRIIRELDEIGSSIKDIWETSYLGKVSNNEAGRTLFKSSIINYLDALQTTGAITEFEPDNVVVERGNDADAVVASISIKPVDSMEFLYMTVTIS